MDNIYTVQTAKYGHNWEDYYSEDSFIDKNNAIQYARDQKTYDKYHYRVVDGTGNVVWTRTIPYEGISINLADENYAWLQDLFGDYGIPKELAFAAILKWLSVHTTPNGI